MGFLGSDGSKLQALDFSLRIFVIPFNVASIWIAISSKQENSTYGNLQFNNFIGLKYLVCISALSSGCALFVALCSWLRFLETKPWLFFVIDQIMAYLMVSSVGAQEEFLYLAYHGDREVSWSQGCVSYAYFCSRLKLAFILQLFALSFLLLLAIISAYKLFKGFHPPSSIPSKLPHHHHTTSI